MATVSRISIARWAFEASGKGEGFAATIPACPITSLLVDTLWTDYSIVISTLSGRRYLN
jgi:hypothetical protein